MNQTSFRFDGLAALIEALKRLPDELVQEAGTIVTSAAEDAAAEIRAAYPVVTGNLRKGVTVKTLDDGGYGVTRQVRTGAPHAHLYEYGYQTRQPKLGTGERTRVEGHNVAVPVIIRHRLRMLEGLRDVVRAAGLTLSADVAAVDAAVLARLSSDPALLTLLPDGVWRDVAPAGTRFVIVQSVFLEDVEGFRAALFQVLRYRVTARVLESSGVDVSAGALRVHDLLHDQDLGPIAGFVHMETLRDGRVGPYLEVDGIDKSIRWWIAGAEYEVHVSPIGP